MMNRTLNRFCRLLGSPVFLGLCLSSLILFEPGRAQMIPVSPIEAGTPEIQITPESAEIPEASESSPQIKESLIREIEDTETQILKAKEEMKALEKQLSETHLQLKQQEQRELDLNKKIEAYKKKINNLTKHTKYFRWNLEKKFPRERKKLLDQKEVAIAEQEALDRIQRNLIRNSLAWPVERSSYRARRAQLSRILLYRILPGFLERKKELIGRVQEIDRQINIIDRDTRLDIKWIDEYRQSIEDHDQNVSLENQNLQEAARRRRLAQQEIDNGKRRVETLQSLVQMLQEKLPLLRQGIDYKSFPEQKGNLLWPIRGKIIHAFGSRKHPDFDLMIDNAGIDIAAEAGDEVRAVADGWVIFSGELPGYGPLVMIHHGGHYFTIYTPAGAIPLQENQRIQQGDVIARVLDTQRNAEPYLHFEIRLQDKSLNPRNWLRTP